MSKFTAGNKVRVLSSREGRRFSHPFIGKLGTIRSTHLIDKILLYFVYFEKDDVVDHFRENELTYSKFTDKPLWRKK